MTSSPPPLYSLKRTPHAGASLYSSHTEVIPPGTLLFEDRALFTLPLSSKSEDDVLDAVRSLSKEGLRSFLELSNCRAGGNKFVGIFKTNVLPAGPQESGIFPLASRLNHSCSPNAEATFSTQTGTLQVYVTSPIEPQQEITISYLSTKLLLPSWSRKQHLLSSFDFECDCPVCPPTLITEEEEANSEITSPALSESDLRRIEIQNLKLQIDKSFATSPRETYLDAIRLVQVCRTERLKLEEAFALATLAQVLIMWGGAGTERCENVVRQVTVAFGIVRGNEGQDAKRWARWLGKTNEHPRAGVLGKWDFEKEISLAGELI